MRKLVVVDKTHLKEKYAGFSLIVSVQYRNYQIFPLAFAIDNKNDDAWEWLFRKFSAFVLNDEDFVFISDRLVSIYAG